VSSVTTVAGPVALRVMEEYCCDQCNEVVYTQVDCPVCGLGNSPTSDSSEIKRGDVVRCRRCGSAFQFLEIDDDFNYIFIEVDKPE